MLRRNHSRHPQDVINWRMHCVMHHAMHHVMHHVMQDVVNWRMLFDCDTLGVVLKKGDVLPGPGANIQLAEYAYNWQSTHTAAAWGLWDGSPEAWGLRGGCPECICFKAALETHDRRMVDVW